MKFGFIAKHRGIWQFLLKGLGMAVRSAGRFQIGFSCLARTSAE